MPSRDHMLGFPGVVDWIPEAKPLPRASYTPARERVPVEQKRLACAYRMTPADGIGLPAEAAPAKTIPFRRYVPVEHGHTGTGLQLLMRAAAKREEAIAAALRDNFRRAHSDIVDAMMYAALGGAKTPAAPATAEQHNPYAWQTAGVPTEPGCYCLRNTTREADLTIQEDGQWFMNQLRPRDALRATPPPKGYTRNPMKRLAAGVEWRRRLMHE